MTMDLPVCLIYVIFYITMKSQYEAKLVRGKYFSGYVGKALHIALLCE